ncbi:30S ribosomal protein S12 methylthiotransferase RimO [Thermorudis peleae]|uniref:30S ribosomal protein S12 methylthiotransferase RimO n=1 Tax=Thermorudis peleae TaxID=1382356 RepID=UPI00057151A3|nr:30S ribosomal protein S12 methylthiotransferase RimO [Thermorudis peleae]
MAKQDARFHIITLGCAKNQVDSEGMAQALSACGLQLSPTPEDADVIIVNTCGFLAASRAESVAAINEMLARRRPGQRVIAAGCMVSLDAHRAEIPSAVDAMISTRNWPQITELVGQLLDIPIAPARPADERPGLVTTFQRTPTRRPSAYVKIADGCDHACSFCTIPLIKGRQTSKRPMEIVREIRELVDAGVKEVVLVSQDTIRYGADLGIQHGLAGLLRLIGEQVPALPWLRLLYLYPSPLIFRVIDAMAEVPACVPYIDMPIQHADPEILRAMARPSNLDQYRRIFAYARERLPNVALRTTVIVGFPGETEQHFERLCAFLEEIAFDHVGVFTYSRELLTPSARHEQQVPPDIAEARRATIMELQQQISLRKNRALVGQVLPVLIEGVGELEAEDGSTEPISAGRAARHAPEVDGLVFVPGAWPIGEFVPVQITEAGPYDLWGEAQTKRQAQRVSSNGRNARSRRGRKASA